MYIRGRAVSWSSVLELELELEEFAESEELEESEAFIGTEELSAMMVVLSAWNKPEVREVIKKTAFPVSTPALAVSVPSAKNLASSPLICKRRQDISQRAGSFLIIILVEV